LPLVKTKINKLVRSSVILALASAVSATELYCISFLVEARYDETEDVRAAENWGYDSLYKV
jgi:hypothetical protein